MSPDKTNPRAIAVAGGVAHLKGRPQPEEGTTQMSTATVSDANVIALPQRQTTPNPRALVPTTRTLLERLVGYPYDDNSSNYEAIVDTLHALRCAAYRALGRQVPFSFNSDPLKPVYDDAANLVSDLADTGLREVQQRYLGDPGGIRWAADADQDCFDRVNEYLDLLAESWLGF